MARTKTAWRKQHRAYENTREFALAQLVCVLVSIEFGVPYKYLMAPTKGQSHQSFARQVAMYLTHVVFQTPICAVGRAFGRDQSTIGYACRLIEDARDDEIFDMRVQKLEDCLETTKVLQCLRGEDVRQKGHA